MSDPNCSINLTREGVRCLVEKINSFPSQVYQAAIGTSHELAEQAHQWVERGRVFLATLQAPEKRNPAQALTRSTASATKFDEDLVAGAGTVGVALLGAVLSGHRDEEMAKFGQGITTVALTAGVFGAVNCALQDGRSGCFAEVFHPRAYSTTNGQPYYDDPAVPTPSPYGNPPPLPSYSILGSYPEPFAPSNRNPDYLPIFEVDLSRLLRRSDR